MPIAIPTNQTLIVKIGTAAISAADGQPNKSVLNPMVAQMAELRAAGNRVLLVTSGAVGIGRSLLGWGPADKLTLPQKSYASMVGQSRLMEIYAGLYKEHGLSYPAQGLLENVALSNGQTDKRKHILACLQVGFSIPMAVPVLNENDFTSFAELKPLNPRHPDIFSDNDMLAALVGRLTNANQIAFISTHCVHNCAPELPEAQKEPFINFADEAQIARLSTQGTSKGGRGGMGNKLDAIRTFVQSAQACGKRTAHVLAVEKLIDSGLLRAFAREKDVGTRLCCAAKPEVKAERRRRLPACQAACCAAP